MNLVELLKRFFAKQAIKVADASIVMTCRGLLHEEELPPELKRDNPFYKGQDR